MKKLLVASAIALALAGCASTPPPPPVKYNLILTVLSTGDEMPYVGVPGGKTPTVFDTLASCRETLAEQKKYLAGIAGMPAHTLTCKEVK